MDMKISGYLEKKGSMRMISSWKKYWFVLEGRLLLYYRSKDEYDSIGPCKGSINLGPPCHVKPCCASSSCAFQIVKKTNTISLRAENRVEQEKWMLAILGALNVQNAENQAKLCHFRYSYDDIVPEKGSKKKSQTLKAPFQRQNTMPERIRVEPAKKDLINRLQKLGAQSYCNSLTKLNACSPKTKCGNFEFSDLIYETATNDLYNRRSLIASNIISQSIGNRETIANNDLYNVSSSSPMKNTEDEAETNEPFTDNVMYNDLYRKSCCSDSEVDIPAVRKQSRREHFYERISGESNDFPTQGQCCDIPEYAVVDKKQLRIDHQYTSIGLSNSSPDIHYTEPLYATPNVKRSSLDCNRNSIVKENNQYISVSEALYEDPEKLLQADLKMEENTKPIRRRAKFLSSMLVKKKPKDVRLKKRKSFIRKIWKKKTPKQEEVSKENCAEPDASLEMLSELQKLLIKKKNALEHNCVSDSLKIEDHQNQDVLKKVNSEENKTKHSGDEEPELPPRSRPEEYHTNLTNMEEVSSTKSLDDILDDLDKEKEQKEGCSSVKMIIEKFNEQRNDEVVLRKTSKSVAAVQRPVTNSLDLNRLLEELGKVTSAPVMPPGVTSSLVTPNMTDEEWLNILPIRTRRFSEPDYDIPRPHRSLIIKARVTDPDNVIPSTRFFGPVLGYTDDERDNNGPSACSSMTPDSLEPQEHVRGSVSIIVNKDTLSEISNNNSSCTYISQDRSIVYDEVIYSQPKRLYTSKVNVCHHQYENLHQQNADNGNGSSVRRTGSIKGDNFLPDSLEHVTEISTAF